MIELTTAHLHYLDVLYAIYCTAPEIRSAEVARRLGVTRASVAQMLSVLMEKGLIVKRRYGTVYLTGRGISLARYVESLADNLRGVTLPQGAELCERERRTAAAAIAAALQERCCQSVLLSTEESAC